MAVVLLGAAAFSQSGPAQNSSIRTSGFSLIETIAVDATDAPRKVFHVQLTIPATPGDFVLFYPKWVPGNHRPSGPVVDTAGIYFRAGGRALTWHRDPVDMYAFHVDIPPGVTSIVAQLDFLSPVEIQRGFSASASSTEKLAVLAWNCLLLYPKGYSSDDIGVKASLKLPSDWQWASALPPVSTASIAPLSSAPGTAEFTLASLTTLVDSPVLMGQYMKKLPLQVGQTPSHELDIAADSAAALEMSAQQAKSFDNLVAEAGALYATKHYRQYHFLLTLSDHIAHSGLEHHESNDSRVGERYLISPTLWALESTLLPHEFTHSWNGKYRRPTGLATPDYQTPMDGKLLWVYEGLTTYFGYVLAARSGMETPEQWREHLADIAMTYSHRPGRNWRSLEDTATDSQNLYDAGQASSNYRRSVDYYNEGALIWLETDTIIRQKSGGKKSIDDFAHLFFGGQNTPPEVKTYTFDDVVTALNQVQPYDWNGFLTTRVQKIAEHAPLGGIANGGWKLVYTDQPNQFAKLIEGEFHVSDATASLGLTLTKEGVVADAIQDGIAAKNGIAPGMKVIAVNGKKYSPTSLLAALKEAQQSHHPLQLLIENTDYYRTVSLNYFDGLRHPHLVRNPTQPDLLTDITKAKLTTPPSPPPSPK